MFDERRTPRGKFDKLSIWKRGGQLSCQVFLPSAAALAVAVAKQTALASVFVTAYGHPQHGEPLCAHADAQDTLVLQLEGCRAWKLDPSFDVQRLIVF